MNGWVLDIETTLDHKTVHCVVVRNVLNHNWVDTFINRTEFQDWLNKREYLDIIGHNILGFDKPLLAKVWGIVWPDIQFIDTLVLSRLANPVREGGHSLAAWGETLGFPKDEFDDYSKYSEELRARCEQDTLITLKVYEALGQHVGSLSSDIEHELQMNLTEMQDYGFMLDKEYAQALQLELMLEMEDIKDELQKTFPSKIEYVQMKTKVKMVETPFNPGSRKQVAERLIEAGWKPTKKTDKGNVIVDELVLEGVDIPEAKLIRRFFLLQKRISQLAQWLEYVEDDSRVHGKIIGCGAITHRASHSSPNMAQVVNSGSEYGHEFRRCWTVPKGRRLVGVDLKGLEGRVLCHYTKDEEYAKAVCFGTKEDGTDIHTVNMHAFGITDRDQAKTAYYALMYGAGADKIAQILRCTKREAQEKIANFYDALPLLKELKAKVERMAKKGFLPGLDGRKVEVRSTHSAMNTLFQSGGAIISKVWLNKTARGLRNHHPSARIVAWVHDELQIECDEVDADSVARIAIDAAKYAGHNLDCRVPIDASANIGYTWDETH